MRLSYILEDIGYLHLEQTPHGYIWNVATLVVEEEYQGLGVGTILMKCACKDADLQGIELWLVPMAIVRAKQQDLIRFYGRLGFEKLGGSGYYRRLPIVAKTPT